jgi:hypothetical protein
VIQADHAAAINILERVSDPDIALHTPHTRVKQILLERADRQRISTADPGLQAPPAAGERTIRPSSYAGMSNEQEAGEHRWVIQLCRLLRCRLLTSRAGPARCRCATRRRS